ncbi:TetR/AcrR family transcriptional regulator [soil metagenome]
MEVREKIIYGAIELFMKYGFKSITMDDIAKNLSISKKTIYQFFKDKDELISTVTELHLEQEQQEFDCIHLEASNSIEELFLTSKCLKKNLSDLNPSILYDLQKYHRNAWKKFIDFKERVFVAGIKSCLEKGIQEGNFRSNINVEILAKLRMEQVQLVFNEDVFPRDKFDFKEVQMQIFEHFIHGITTPQGQELLEQYYNNTIES